MGMTPAAASVLIRDVLDGPAQSARVLGVHPSCVYVEVGHQVLAVETSDALGLPGAVRIAARSTDGVLSGVRRNARVVVGSGVISVDAMTLPINRWWRPRRARGGVDPARAVSLARTLSGHPLPFDVFASPEDLLGRGDGLTPAGDDVVAGALVALQGDAALALPYTRVVESAAYRRTTTLSATLLHQAGAGYAIPAVLDVADLLAGHGDVEALGPAVQRLIAVGHSSGTALAWGLLRGARELVTKMGLPWEP